MGVEERVRHRPVEPADLVAARDEGGAGGFEIAVMAGHEQDRAARGAGLFHGGEPRAAERGVGHAGPELGHAVILDHRAAGIVGDGIGDPADRLGGHVGPPAAP